MVIIAIFILAGNIIIIIFSYAVYFVDIDF